MEMPSITGWEGHLTQGIKYLRTARRGHHRPAVFNNELVFQLAAMGIEHLMAGMCQYHRQMPTDHTLSGLVTALAGVCPLDAELTRRIGMIEAAEGICSLSATLRPSPGNELVEAILDVGQDLVMFAKQKLPLQDVVPTPA